MRKYDVPRQHRREGHVILMTIALALVAGRIATVSSVEGDTAFLSANDRSRWATVSALVEDGTYAIDRQIAIRSADGKRTPWNTIDKVRHVGPDGELHYYSSKATLLPTLVAGVYAIVNQATGLTLTEQPIYLPRLLLLLINLPILATYLVAMMVVIELLGASDFARRFVYAATCFGTLVTPFAITLNNHLVAAAAMAVAMAIYLWVGEKTIDDFTASTYFPRFWPWFASGIACGLAVANELPALSIVVLWGVLLGLLSRLSISPFLAGLAVVAIGIFGTNWIAHDTWSTPYAHRGDGEILERLVWSPAESDEADSDVDPLLGDLFNASTNPDGGLIATLRRTETLASALTVRARPLISGGYEVQATWPGSAERRPGQSPSADTLKLYKLVPDAAELSFVDSWLGRTELASVDDESWQLRAWDDWYEYPGSYWRESRRRGVDLGEPSRLRYLFHSTFGYYGLFSLTPIWLLVPLGLATGCVHGPIHLRRLMMAIAIATAVCFLFYLSRPEIDRNYGGVSVGFRWMIWFAPFWLASALPEVSEWSESRKGRVAALLLLAGSVVTVSTSLETPWQSPWILRLASFLGWLGEELTR